MDMHSNGSGIIIEAQVRDGRIYVKSDYALKEIAKAISGYKWDGDAKQWHYPASPTSAANIRTAYEAATLVTGMLCDDDMLKLLATAEQADEGLTRSRSTDLPDLPTKTTAWLHQRQCYALLRDRSGVLGMGMGTGKTLTYVGLLDGNDAQAAIIVTTKKGRRVFPKQFALHSEREWAIVNGVRKRNGELKKTAPLADYVDTMRAGLAHSDATGQPVALVVHYDVIWREPMKSFLLDVLKTRKTFVIYDESHRMKAPGGKSSRAAAIMQPHAARIWQGSGSYMAHSKLDVYAQARALDPAYFGTNYKRFRNRFANFVPLGGKVDSRGEPIEVLDRDDPWKNEAEFERILSQFVYFADTDDVLDLPPVQDLIEPVDLDAEARKLLKNLESDFATEIADGTVTANNALTKLLRQQQATSGHAVLDDEDGTGERKVLTIDRAKQDALREILSDLPPHEKVVVMCRFTHDLRMVREVVEELGRTYHEVSGQAEDLTNDATMRDDTDVLGVQIQSGSEAVDFTAARYCVYYSLGFSLKDYEQSRRRVHRPGQTRPTFYYHLVASGTVDEKVYNALAERKSVIQSVIDAVKAEHKID